LEQETIKAIVDFHFNLGKGVAHLETASKGLSILACRSRTSAETKRICKHECTLLTMEKTRQLDELLRLSKGNTRTLADNFFALKLNIATLMGLVWVLFGMECDYYNGLHQVFKTLELKEVVAQKVRLTPENCHWITWAILDDGRTFF
jgi:hypothetical protein